MKYLRAVVGVVPLGGRAPRMARAAARCLVSAEQLLVGALLELLHRPERSDLVLHLLLPLLGHSAAVCQMTIAPIGIALRARTCAEPELPLCAERDPGWVRPDMPGEITSVIAELEEGLAGPPSFRRDQGDPAVWLARISDQVGQAGRAAWRSAETRQVLSGQSIPSTASHPAVFRTRMICVAVLAIEAATAAESSRTMREPDDAIRRAMLEAIESDLTDLEARELEQLQLELLRDVGTAACTASLLGRRIGSSRARSERSTRSAAGASARWPSSVTSASTSP